MKERDMARSEIKHSSGDKWIALQKYRTLRNRVTGQVRNDVRNENGKRIDEACNESEYWNVVNDIIKPKNDTKWKLEDSDHNDITNEEVIATKFNEFFVNKIEDLKANIDPNLKTDPLIHLEKKMEHKNLYGPNYDLILITMLKG